MFASRGEFVQKSVGADREEPIAQFKGVLVPTDWSPDGRFVLCVDPNNKETGPDLTLVPTDGGKPIPFVNTRAAETWGQFSPDGHWVAYQSNESGQNQIFVRAVSNQSRSVQVSISGGTQARWSRDAKEVFYIAPNGTLMTVPIAVRGGSVEGGTPESLFQTRIVGGGAARLGRRQQYRCRPRRPVPDQRCARERASADQLDPELEGPVKQPSVSPAFLGGSGMIRGDFRPWLEELKARVPTL